MLIINFVTRVYDVYSGIKLYVALHTKKAVKHWPDVVTIFIAGIAMASLVRVFSPKTTFSQASTTLAEIALIVLAGHATWWMICVWFSNSSPLRQYINAAYELSAAVAAQMSENFEKLTEMSAEKQEAYIDWMACNILFKQAEDGKCVKVQMSNGLNHISMVPSNPNLLIGQTIDGISFQALDQKDLDAMHKAVDAKWKIFEETK